MRKPALLAVCCILSFGIFASTLHAEIIAVEGRYFMDRSTLAGMFYSTGEAKGDQVVFKFCFGGVTTGYTRQYLCKEKWEWEKIQTATIKIAEYLRTEKSIDVQEMLKKVGFTPLKLLDN